MRWRIRSALARFLAWLFGTSLLADAIRDSQRRPDIWGDPNRVSIHPTAFPENTVMNVNSGHITVGAHSFFGQQVMLTTGAHEYERRGLDRHPFPAEGRDIEIGEYVWIASRAVVCGPCRIGDNAVVAAGAVVVSDVPPDTIVAGVPARPIRVIQDAQS